MNSIAFYMILAVLGRSFYEDHSIDRTVYLRPRDIASIDDADRPTFPDGKVISVHFSYTDDPDS